MDKIKSYDFMSFLLPGILVATSFYVFFTTVIPIIPKGINFHDLKSVGSSLVFLLIAFLAGHIVQILANEYEIGQMRYWRKRPLKTAKHPEVTLENKKVRRNRTPVKILAIIFPCLRLLPFSKNAFREELGLIKNENGGWYSTQLLRAENPIYDEATKRAIREGGGKSLM